MENIYLDLTTAFNRGRFRAVICSGQAVVLHRLAIMSKDGDWILREDEAALAHVLSVLGERGAIYRYGAPLDVRWLRGGWSSHFEFPHDGVRVRTDFFSRPPRLGSERMRQMWDELDGSDPPFTPAADLALIKMTQREKDYPVIGELARIMPRLKDRLRFSRSAQDLCKLAALQPDDVAALVAERPLLSHALEQNPDRLAEAIDAERRGLIKADAVRMRRYEQAAAEWRERWPQTRQRVEGLPLDVAHRIITDEASGRLPEVPD